MFFNIVDSNTPLYKIFLFKLEVLCNVMKHADVTVNSVNCIVCGDHIIHFL
jgi:hypothetical protein